MEHQASTRYREIIAEMKEEITKQNGIIKELAESLGYWSEDAIKTSTDLLRLVDGVPSRDVPVSGPKV